MNNPSIFGWAEIAGTMRFINHTHISPRAPFALWAMMALLGFGGYWFIRERG